MVNGFMISSLFYNDIRWTYRTCARLHDWTNKLLLYYPITTLDMPQRQYRLVRVAVMLVSGCEVHPIEVIKRPLIDRGGDPEFQVLGT